MGVRAWYDENTTKTICTRGNRVRRSEPHKLAVPLLCSVLSMGLLTPRDSYVTHLLLGVTP